MDKKNNCKFMQDLFFCLTGPKRLLRGKTGLEVIKLENSLRLKIKCNDWLLADTCPQAANHCAYFESENELKFYNLKASFSQTVVNIYIVTARD